MSEHAISPGPRDAAQEVAHRISEFTYQWLSERELQDAMWGVLSGGFSARREVVLSVRDRADFVVKHGFSVAIEVKVAGSRNPILRQLGRYAEHDSVDALVLASARRTLLHAMPAAIHGKPLAVALVAGSL